MSKNKGKVLFALFDQLGITTSTVRHKALYSVSETADIERDLKGSHCKNLFLKDKKGRFLFVVMMGARRMDIR
jgi:Ala-tRNA(Pro) deacylase